MGRARLGVADGEWTVSTFNAQYKPGLVDGTASQARFRSPTAVIEVPLEAVESQQDVHLKDSSRGPAAAVIVADTQNNVLRCAVISLVGAGGKGSYVKKFAPSGVWMRPRGMCCVSDGMLVADSGHHRIRSVSFDGRRVLPFAGCGKKGHKDGPVLKAMFDNPSAVCVCPSDGSIIVADTGNNALRRIHNGMVTTLAGPGGGPGEDRHASGLVDGESLAARFRRPTHVLFDTEESLLVVDSLNHCVRVVAPDWTEVRTLAGAPRLGARDGPVDVAEFHTPEAACVLAGGGLAITDRENNKVRLLSAGMGEVSTLVGTGQWGALDGPASAALLNHPTGICALASGHLVVCDTGNNCLRLLTPPRTPKGGGCAAGGWEGSRGRPSVLGANWAGAGTGADLEASVREVLESSDEEEALDAFVAGERAGPESAAEGSLSLLDASRSSAAWGASRNIKALAGSDPPPEPARLLAGDPAALRRPASAPLRSALASRRGPHAAPRRTPRPRGAWAARPRPGTRSPSQTARSPTSVGSRWRRRRGASGTCTFSSPSGSACGTASGRCALRSLRCRSGVGARRAADKAARRTGPGSGTT